MYPFKINPDIPPAIFESHLNILTSNNDKTKSIWSANESQQEYYEIEILTDKTPDIDLPLEKTMDDILNLNKYMCHICNIAVPRTYMKEHNNSAKHKTCNDIAKIALERSKLQMQLDLVGSRRLDILETYFCDACATVVSNANKEKHEATRAHKISSKHDELLIELFKIYSDIENVEVNSEIDELELLQRDVELESAQELGSQNTEMDALENSEMINAADVSGINSELKGFAGKISEQNAVDNRIMLETVEIQEKINAIQDKLNAFENIKQNMVEDLIKCKPAASKRSRNSRNKALKRIKIQKMKECSHNETYAQPEDKEIETIENIYLQKDLNDSFKGKEIIKNFSEDVNTSPAETSIENNEESTLVDKKDITDAYKDEFIKAINQYLDKIKKYAVSNFGIPSNSDTKVKNRNTDTKHANKNYEQKLNKKHENNKGQKENLEENNNDKSVNPNNNSKHQSKIYISGLHKGSITKCQTHKMKEHDHNQVHVQSEEKEAEISIHTNDLQRDVKDMSKRKENTKLSLEDKVDFLTDDEKWAAGKDEAETCENIDPPKEPVDDVTLPKNFDCSHTFNKVNSESSKEIKQKYKKAMQKKAANERVIETREQNQNIEYGDIDNKSKETHENYEQENIEQSKDNKKEEQNKVKITEQNNNKVGHRNKKDGKTNVKDTNIRSGIQPPTVPQPNKSETPSFNLVFYLKDISRRCETKPIHTVEAVTNTIVQITAINGDKIKVPINNFHSFHMKASDIYCKVCQSPNVRRPEWHIIENEHRAQVMIPINDVNGIRQLDDIWSHCIICNDLTRNVEFHLRTQLHKNKIKLCLVELKSKDLDADNTVGKEKKLTGNEQELFTALIVKNHLAMTNKDYLNCIICDVIVNYDLSSVQQHINSFDHLNKFEQQRIENRLVDIDEDRLYCIGCDIHISKSSIVSHCNRKKHTKLLQELLVKQGEELVETDETEIVLESISQSVKKETKGKMDESELICFVCNIIIYCIDEHTDSFEHKKSYFKYLEANKLNEIETDTFYCIPCNTVITIGYLMSHCTSRKHKVILKNCINNERNSQTAESESLSNSKTCFQAPSTSRVPESLPTKTVNSTTMRLKVLYQFREMTDPTKLLCIVCDEEVTYSCKLAEYHASTLDHVVAFNLMMLWNKIKKRDNKYFCDICRVDITYFNEISHVLGKQHAKNLSKEPKGTVYEYDRTLVTHAYAMSHKVGDRTRLRSIVSVAKPDKQ